MHNVRISVRSAHKSLDRTALTTGVLDGNGPDPYDPAMTVTYLDPRGTTTRPIEPYEATLRIPAGKPLVIGLLANGFPDSEPFLHRVGEALLAHTPTGTKLMFRNKGNASAPAPEPLVDEMAAEAHCVVAAYGH